MTHASFNNEIEVKDKMVTTLELKRSVIIKQYAPETFESIRKFHNISIETLTESLEPSKNIK